MSILEYNGGGVLAMKGKECLVLICDKRLGVRLTTISMNHTKIYEIHPHLYICLPGLATDALTVYQKLKLKVNMYELEQNRQISPKTFASMVSNLLYEHRFGPYFVEPIIAGLDPLTGETYIAAMDSIGSCSVHKDFAAAGHNQEQVIGISEAIYQPNLEPEDLFEVASQSFLSACDRDAGSGWGAFAHIIEKDKITTRSLKGRMD